MNTGRAYPQAFTEQVTPKVPRNRRPKACASSLSYRLDGRASNKGSGEVVSPNSGSDIDRSRRALAEWEARMRSSLRSGSRSQFAN